MTMRLSDSDEPAPLPLIHKSRAPVILLGQGSSGTSILSLLLRRHFQVCFGTETQFLVDFANSIGRYGNLDVSANRRRLLKDLLCERYFRMVVKYGYTPDENRIWGRIQEHSLAGLVDAALGDFAEQSGMVRWGDKTPLYVYHLPVIYELFPAAKYIHLIRDGRDVTLSLFARHWGAKSAFIGAWDWRGNVLRVREFFPRFQPNQLIELRYCDLLNQPEKTAAQLVAFLEIDDSEGRLAPQLAQRIRREVRVDNIDKWRTGFTAAQVRQFDEIAGDVLRTYGFETCTTEVRHHFPWWSWTYWRVHTRVRNLMFRQNWQQNLYRLRVRLRYSLQRLRLVGTAEASASRDRSSTP